MVRYFILALLLVFKLQAQDFNNYTPIVCEGKIPEDVLKLSSEKYFSQSASWKTDEKVQVNADISEKKQSKLEDDFILKSTFNIDRLLKSGKIVFEHPMCTYINKIADYLLENEPELRKKLSFYVLKSSFVNAFSTHQGIIFISLGLIAQVENEAQLAFVIAHEIAHYKKKHVISSYVDKQVIVHSSNDIRNSSFLDKLHLYFNYSKENESEADSIGFNEIFIKSAYDFSQVNKVFDVLLYSYLPFDEIKFNTDLFETKQISFPEEYLLKELSEIAAVEDYDDSESTHPNIKKRRASMYNQVNSMKETRGEKFIVSEDDFNKFRKIARFELPHIYINERKFSRALYTSYLLLRNDPQNAYLKNCIGTSLYGLSKYKNIGEFANACRVFSEVEGEEQQVNYFFDKVTKMELNIMSVRWLKKITMDNPSDEFSKKMMKNSMVDLFLYSEYLPSDFDRASADTSESMVLLADSVYEKLSKYEKIEYKKKINAKASGKSYSNYFADVYDDTFKAEMDEAFKDAEKIKEEEKNNKSYSKRNSWRQFNFKRKVKIDKLVIIEPTVIQYRTYKDEVGERYFASEERQRDLIAQIPTYCSKLNIQANLLDIKSFKESDVKSFNDYVILSSWFSEFFLHDEFNEKENNNYICYNTKFMSELQKKYDTKYVAWVGAFSERRKREVDQSVVSCSILLFPTLPILMTYMMIPANFTYYVFMVFDVEKSEICMIDARVVKADLKTDVLRSFIYDSLNKLNK
ncbi:MAG: hypothetical protein A2W91_09070 [Bacteroidetes bacterium GWF2_38_335]|nr:MAG: hypothetical protein A2W91_09070 [Bacteroidetes bacterium GWF2_38_335]